MLEIERVNKLTGIKKKLVFHVENNQEDLTIESQEYNNSFYETHIFRLSIDDVMAVSEYLNDYLKKDKNKR
jgi:hypothetical protein